MSAERATALPLADEAWKASLLGHLDRLRHGAERLRTLGLEDWRWTSPAAVDVAHHEVAVRTRELLRATLVELERTQLTCQTLLESTTADARAMREAHDIDSLVFAARADLQQFDHLLRRTHLEEDPFVTLEACQRAARHLRRSQTAVARVLASRVGVPVAFAVSDDDERELEHARVLRAAYARLRREVTRSASLGALDARIDAAARALEQLLADEVFVGARLSDKRLLWQLHARVRAADALDAERWLGDLSAVSELLLGINRRELLARHDLATLELAERSLTDPVQLPLLLTRVEGLDERLDALRGGWHPELHGVVLEVARRLRTARTGGVA